MTIQLSDIVLSVIVAALGIAGYIIVRPSRTSVQLGETAYDRALAPSKQETKVCQYHLQEASALYAKAWGKSWPQSQGTILKTEISDDGTSSVDDDDVDGALADKLNVPSHFKYRYLKEMRHVTMTVGTGSGMEEDDVLIVREDYEMLRQALEDDVKYYRSFVVTGHPGIGSYESWFSSLESNADLSPILRQDHLSLIPSFISS
jgi:hypothetical protein